MRKTLEPLGFFTPLDATGSCARPRFEVPDPSEDHERAPVGVLEMFQAELFQVAPISHREIYRGVACKHVGGGSWSLQFPDRNRTQCDIHAGPLLIAARLSLRYVVDRLATGNPALVSDCPNFPKPVNASADPVKETRGGKAAPPRDTFWRQN